MSSEEVSFLYATETEVVCMNPATYEESTFPITLLPSNRIKLINDGMLLTVTISESGPISIATPNQASYEVKDTSMASTSSSGDNCFKPAVLV